MPTSSPEPISIMELTVSRFLVVMKVRFGEGRLESSNALRCFTCIFRDPGQIPVSLPKPQKGHFDSWCLVPWRFRKDSTILVPQTSKDERALASCPLLVVDLFNGHQKESNSILVGPLNLATNAPPRSHENAPKRAALWLLLEVASWNSKMVLLVGVSCILMVPIVKMAPWHSPTSRDFREVENQGPNLVELPGKSGTPWIPSLGLLSQNWLPFPLRQKNPISSKGEKQKDHRRFFGCGS